MSDLRETTANGLRATWRLRRMHIEILDVHYASHTADITFPPGTDLAAARERHPEWAELWNKIRHEYWLRLAPSAGAVQHTAEQL
ncbi:hypothetical protein [Nocardia blacklockiae]|uniref:hypothetical protein n=1 Tax=Nocardia blacklockiae TaxID=480036 RepID=UPI0018950FFB|nr:hypothetical protein [Nocardia blacklockiae]MBF6171319.1 hypothetical protein [Nocardia blacklockiae]